MRRCPVAPMVGPPPCSDAMAAWLARPKHRRGPMPDAAAELSHTKPGDGILTAADMQRAPVPAVVAAEKLSHTSAGDLSHTSSSPVPRKKSRGMSPAPLVILSLCDLTGNWPHPYEEAGYKVIRVDLSEGSDVRLLPFIDDPIHGILAAPPCTKFCRLGQTRGGRSPAEMCEALAVVDACLRAVAIYRPKWWALENPPGKLTRYLGPPQFKFQPCDFGAPWTKLTYLWGNFTPPSWRTTPDVKPCLPTVIDRTRSTVDDAARSATPMGFANAFFGANP